MQNKLSPIIQSIALITVPVLVVLILNYILAMTGKTGEINVLITTFKMCLFLIPNALFIILHKYKLSYFGFLIAIIATVLAVLNVNSNNINIFSSFSLYLVNFIYFSLLIGVTYLAYFVITGFKLKNIIFILGGIITHTISFLGLFLINKQPVNIELTRVIMFTGADTFLKVGLALAIGLLFFELPSPQKEAEYGYYGDEDDDN